MPRVKPDPTPTGGLIDRPSRYSIFARRQRRLLKPAILAILAVAGAGGVLHVTHLMRSEQSFAPMRAELGHKVAMRVTAITVTGRDMTPEAMLDQALGVKVGDDMLGFSVEEARKRIDQLTFVEHATVERRLPGTILVQLTERRPFAVWQNQGRFVLIDRKGALVADQGMNGKDAEAFSQLPLVVGAGAPEAAEALITALDGEPDVRAHVVASVRVGQRRWNLTLRNGCDVMLPEGEELVALHRLAQLQRSQKLLVRPLEAIDMRLPDRLVVRQRPTAAVDPANPDGNAMAGTSDAAQAGTIKLNDAKPNGTQATGAKPGNARTGATHAENGVNAKRASAGGLPFMGTATAGGQSWALAASADNGGGHG